MKDYILLNYDYLFSDHMACCSHQAKLYYIKLMFYANNGFVANPFGVLDSLGYDRGVFDELVTNEELLTLPGRSEVFITAYFIHTKFKPMSWLSNPFSIYWKGKLYIKKNGVATFKPQEPETDPLDVIQPPVNEKADEIKRCLKGIVDSHYNAEPKEDSLSQWDAMLDDLEKPSDK